MTDENPRRIDDILEKDLGNEVVLYTPNGKEIHVLNGSAYVIWTLCDGQHSPEDIEQAILAQYAVPDGEEGNVAADVVSTLATFSERGLTQAT